MAQSSVQRIDKFDVLRRLGRGGMGSVYLARDPDMDRLVAIKLLNEGFDEGELRGRFTSEARSASALRHTNIVTIFQTGTYFDRPFIVMEYVAGETFADIIASGRPVSMEEKLLLLDQLLAGLQHAHAKGIVHRDIKPSNVMVDGEGVVRILDFGIARLGDGGLTRTGAVLGTLNYIAPEQLAGQVVDMRADIFAAGLVSYELLSSRRAFPQPFPEILQHIAFKDPPPLEDLCPGIEPGLVRIINRCLAKQANERYSDCAAVRRELDVVRQAGGGAVAAAADAVQAGGSKDPAPAPSSAALPTVVIPRPPTSTAETLPSTPAPIVHRRRRLIAYAGAALLVIAIAVGMWRARGTPEQSSEVATPSAAPVVESAPAPPASPVSQPAPSPPRRAEVTSGRRTAPPPSPVRVGGTVKPPKQIKRVNPEYPPVALSARLQGVVILETTIGTNGNVSDVRVLRSIPLLDSAAVAAVRQWVYEPTIVNGRAVPVIISVAVEFKLAPPAPVRVGGAIKPPVQTKRVSPPYPPEAQAAGVQGVVIMEVSIGADGKVTDVRVLRSIPLLDQAAIDAVRQWEYAPTIVDGTPVPILMTVTLNFALTPAAPPVPRP